LDARARTEEIGCDSRWTGCRMVKRCESNSFAATALRWLVPNPLFLHSKIVLPSDFKKSDKFVSPDVIRLGRNLHSQPDDGKNWQWFDSSGELDAWSVANIRGWPMQWGPEIQKVVTDEPRLKHLCYDEIAAWRDYFSRRKFDLDTPWEESPPQFQRVFTGLWSQMLGNHFGVHETDYFKGPNVARKLMTNASTVVKAANQCIANLVSDLGRVKRGESETVCPHVPTKGGNSMREVPQFVFSPSESDLAKIFHFEDLARNRIFVVPHVLRRSDAKKVVEDFQRQLVTQLPDDHELLGTRGFWESHVAIEKIEREHGLKTTKAIGAFVRQKWGPSAIQRQTQISRDQLKRWFKNGTLLPAPQKSRRREHAEWLMVKEVVNPILRATDRTYRNRLKTRVDYIRKLRAATFPRLNVEALIAIPPHKSNKPK